jgi:hypothetical protein
MIHIQQINSAEYTLLVATIDSEVAKWVERHATRDCDNRLVLWEKISPTFFITSMLKSTTGGHYSATISRLAWSQVMSN